MRYEIVGPKVTFLSRLEDLPDDYRPVVDVKGKGKGKEIQNDEARGDMESGRRRLIEVIGEAGQVGWSAGQEEGLKAVQEARDKEAAVGPNTSDPEASIPTPAPEPSTSTTKIDFSHPLTRLAAANLPPPVVAKPRAPAGTTPGVSRNYLIIEEFEGASHGEEMQALFGEHVDWEKEVVPASESMAFAAFWLCAEQFVCALCCYSVQLDTHCVLFLVFRHSTATQRPSLRTPLSPPIALSNLL